jgi:hypothetical protein
MKMALTKLMVAVFALFTVISHGMASTTDLPSEQEMREFMKVGAEEQYSCSYQPKHFIDLEAGLHGLRAVVPVRNHYEPRDLTAAESQQLLKVLATLPTVIVTESGSDIWFETKEGASESEILRDLYILKRTVHELSGVYLKSTAPCPGTVSVGNL